jgi:hypothetical protein
MATTLLTTPNYGTYPTGYGNVTITAGGLSGTAYTLAAGGTGSNGTYSHTNGGWTTSASPLVTVGATKNAALQVSGDAEFQGKVKLQGVDIGEVLTKIQDRLAILVPDPARLAKYEALKQAYEQYKLLEALCVEETNPGAEK